MSRVIDTTFIEDSQYLLSQTPPNYVEQNYFLKELQDKIDADWRFRPNRKWIEQELEPGSEIYTPVEVVIQSVLNDKNDLNSDDRYRVVFRDCQQHNRLGKRYRFSYDFIPDQPDEQKIVWMGMNHTNISSTSSQVIWRCNGSLGSIYTDENGKNHIHYEPVINPLKLVPADIHFSEVANDPIGELIIIAQYNKYTAQYYINQRFIVGYDKVCKIVNIIKADSLTTYDPYDVGVMKIYLTQDQAGDLDNFKTRIAYNGIKEYPMPEDEMKIEEQEYSLIINSPLNIPKFLTEDGFTFSPQVLLGDVPQSVEVDVSIELVGPYADKADKNYFCQLIDNGDGSYFIKRLEENLGLAVKVICVANIDDEELRIDFVMQLRDF